MSESKQQTLFGTYLPEVVTTKELVARVLSKIPEARDSDNILIDRVIRICIDKGLKRPSYETITRCRRYFNAQGYFLPSSKVLEQRRNKQQFMAQASREGYL